MFEVATNDGKRLKISQAIWECYFPEELREISLPYNLAHFLFRMLSGELIDKKLTEWAKKETENTFAGNL